MPTHYPYLLNPSVYPDYTRRPVQVPTWETFHHATQFTTLRVFSQRDGKLVNYREDLDLYTETFKLGRIIWPVIHTLHAGNFADLVAEIRRRGLYLFDFWGHVPGSGMEGMWSHITPPPDAPLRVLQQYGLVIAAGALTMSREFQDTLRAYVDAGGQVVVTGTNARGLVPGLELGTEPRRIPGGATVRWWNGDKETRGQGDKEIGSRGVGEQGRQRDKGT